MKLILVRHPSTIENEKRIVQGKHTGKVSKKGLKQSKKLISRLKKENIDFIISSDADRCITLTKMFLKKRGSPHKITGIIDEKSYGSCEGMKASEIEEKNMEGNTPKKRKYPGGESLIDVEKRAKQFLKSLKPYENTGKTFLIVSHEIFLSVLIGIMLKMDILDARYAIRIDNCSLSKVEKMPERWSIQLLNETSFLD